MPDATHERLKELARARKVSVNKLIEEFSTAALAEFDAEVRFRARATIPGVASRCWTSLTAPRAGRHAGAPADQNRPLRDGTVIGIGVVVERFQASGSIDALAQDYGRPKEDIEEILECEFLRAAPRRVPCASFSSTGVMKLK